MEPISKGRKGRKLKETAEERRNREGKWWKGRKRKGRKGRKCRVPPPINQNYCWVTVKLNNVRSEWLCVCGMLCIKRNTTVNNKQEQTFIYTACCSTLHTDSHSSGTRVSKYLTNHSRSQWGITQAYQTHSATSN